MERVERDELERLVVQGLSQRDIARELGRTQATVAHWLRRHGLTAQRPASTREPDEGPHRRIERLCAEHGLTTHARRDSGWRCLKCRADAVVRRRQRVKRILVAEAGGGCVICGYDRWPGALQFHHVDPATKTFGVGGRGLSLAIDVLRAEAAKCVLLCATCHAEVEGGVAHVPSLDSGAAIPGDVMAT